MDLSFIAAATGAITSARELGKAVIGVRDFSESASKIAQIQDLLLKAQDSLFPHGTQLMQLQNEHFEATKKLRELEEALAERGRYSLFEITRGNFVYRSNPAVVPENGHVGNPLAAEPQHYLCQACFDKGVKSVMAYEAANNHGVIEKVICPICRRRIDFNGWHQYGQ